MSKFDLTAVQVLAYRIGYAAANGAKGIRVEVMTLPVGDVYELVGRATELAGEGKFLVRYPDEGDIAAQVSWVEPNCGEVVGEVRWDRLVDILRETQLPVAWKLSIPEATDLLRRWLRNPMNRAFVEYGTPPGWLPDFRRLPAMLQGAHWLLYHGADKVVVWLDLPAITFWIGKMHQGEPFVWVIEGGRLKPGEVAEMADPPAQSIVIGRADYLKFAAPEAWDATDR